MALLLLGCVLAALWAGVPWLFWPRFGGYAPTNLAAVRVGMTRQKVEATLGKPLPTPAGRSKIGVWSNSPNRFLPPDPPDLIEEEGLWLRFDDQDVLREATCWSFVRHESLREWARRMLGL